MQRPLENITSHYLGWFEIVSGGDLSQSLVENGVGKLTRPLAKRLLCNVKLVFLTAGTEQSFCEDIYHLKIPGIEF